MRLKNNGDRSVLLFKRLNPLGNLGRMMRIVGYNRAAVRQAHDFATPCNSAEPLYPCFYVAVAGAERITRGDRQRGVFDIERLIEARRKSACVRVAVIHIERIAENAHDVVVIAAETHARAAFDRFFKQRIVAVVYYFPASSDKRGKRLQNLVRVPIGVGVVEVHVGYHSDVGLKSEKTAPVLARFGDEQIFARLVAELILSAEMYGRI